MKQRIFSTLLFSVLLLFALNLQGHISYTSNPSVGVDHSSFTKYKDVVTGAESWYRGWLNGTVTVYVSAGMSGVGEGQGTLTGISIFGNSIGTHQDGVDTAGSTNTNGSWSSGTGTADAEYSVSLPDSDVDGKSWSWSSGGSTSIWPKEWHESVTVGGRVQIPSGVSGSYSTTGSWQNGTSITRSANSGSGTITLSVRYKCSACSSYGDTASAVCGSGAGVSCPSSSCSCSGASDDDDDGSSSSGCGQSTNANYCNDQGSCSAGSNPGVPSTDCGENYCCCPGSTTPPTITPSSSGSTPPSSGSGSGSGGSSSSPGCGQSAYYDWCNDAGSCSVGSGAGVPGPECGENYCCCP